MVVLSPYLEVLQAIYLFLSPWPSLGFSEAEGRQVDQPKNNESTIYMGMSQNEECGPGSLTRGYDSWV